MAFTATPVDGSTPAIPMSSAVPDTTNTPLALEGGPSKTTGGNNLVPAAVYMYDGYNVTQGTQADAAATTDAGTFSLIALVKRLLGKLLVGAQTTANSVAVNIASDQVVPAKRSTVAVYTLASGALTASGNSGDLTVGPYTEISLDINITAQSGTGPTIQFFYERKGAEASPVYYPLWQSAVFTSSVSLPNPISTSIGAGMAYNQSLGLTGRLRWVIAGTTPSWTLSANIYGK